MNLRRVTLSWAAHPAYSFTLLVENIMDKAELF
jgi:hypothetical protein